MFAKITNNSETLARITSAALFAAILGGVWDAWKHDSGGFESIFSPPHLLIYCATLVGIFASIRAFFATQNPLWRRLSWAFALVIVSAPIDQMWHTLFGIEDVGTSWVVWSPPHVLLVVSLISASLFLALLLQREPDIQARRLFTNLVWSAGSAFAIFLVVPFIPIGPYHIIGFWGAFPFVFVFASVFIYARIQTEGIGIATEIALFSLVLASIGLWQPVNHGPSIPYHEHLPGWLLAASILVPAIALDILYTRYDGSRLGAIVGILLSGILFLFSRGTFTLQFYYSNIDMQIGIVTGLMGGALGGYMAEAAKKAPVLIAGIIVDDIHRRVFGALPRKYVAFALEQLVRAGIVAPDAKPH